MTVMSHHKPSLHGAVDGTSKVRIMRAALIRGTALALAISLGACANNANVDVALKSQAQSSSTTLLDLAWAAAARDDHYAAIPMFRRAHQKSSGRAEPLIGLGHSLIAIGHYEDAVGVLKKAIGKDEGHAGAYLALGQSLLVLGHYDEAVSILDKAVALNGGSPEALSALGVAFDATGNHDRALSTFHQASNRYPGDLDIQSNYGLSLALHEEPDTALDILEEVVRNGSSTARHRQNLALAYAFANDMRRAAKMASIDLDRDSVLANLGYVDMLRALPPKDRMAAMLGGTANPKRTVDGAARRGIQNDDPWVRQTIARLLPDEVAEVMEPTPVETEEDPVALGGVPPLVDPNGWAVQIAAYRKIEHLAPGWDYLSEKYAHIIGGLEPRRSEVDHPPSGAGPVGFFYRLNAGPLRDKSEAVAICEQMKAEGGECWVRAPEPAEGRLPDDPAAEEDFISSADHNAVMNQMARAVVEEDPELSIRPLPDTKIAYNPPIVAPEIMAREHVANLTVPDAPLEAPVVVARHPVSALTVPAPPLEAPMVTARQNVTELTAPKAPLEAPIVAARADIPSLKAPKAPFEPITMAATFTPKQIDTAKTDVEDSYGDDYPISGPIEAPVIRARTFVPVLSAPIQNPTIEVRLSDEDEALIFGRHEAETQSTSIMSVGTVKDEGNGVVRLNARPNKYKVLSAFEDAEEALPKLDEPEKFLEDNKDNEQP